MVVLARTACDSFAIPYPAIFPAVFHFHRHTSKTPARARSRLGVVGWQKTPYPPRVRGISRPPGTGCGAGGGLGSG